jgi:hypothetical protein
LAVGEANPAERETRLTSCFRISLTCSFISPATYIPFKHLRKQSYSRKPNQGFLGPYRFLDPRMEQLANIKKSTYPSMLCGNHSSSTMRSSHGAKRISRKWYSWTNLKLVGVTIFSTKHRYSICLENGRK